MLRGLGTQVPDLADNDAAAKINLHNYANDQSAWYVAFQSLAAVIHRSSQEVAVMVNQHSLYTIVADEN